MKICKIGDAARLLVELCNYMHENNISFEDIESASDIDAEVKYACNYAYDMFTHEQHDASIFFGEEYFKTKYSNIMVSKSGKVIRYNDNLNRWCKTKPSFHQGYPTIIINRKHVHLARIMLETFMREYTIRTECPNYKDGNKNNCSIENLAIVRKNTRPSIADIDRACQLISEYVKNNDNYGVSAVERHLAANNSVSHTCVKSILRGSYSEISEKYFIIENKKIIPNII